MLPGFCPARFGVLFCSVYPHIKLLDHAVSGARCLTGVCLSDIAHCRSVTLLCMLYKIRCTGRTSIYLCAASLQDLAVSREFYSVFFSVPLADRVFDGVGLAGFKSRANSILSNPAVVTLFLLSVYRLV